jgi:hypothetical protein
MGPWDHSSSSVHTWYSKGGRKWVIWAERRQGAVGPRRKKKKKKKGRNVILHGRSSIRQGKSRTMAMAYLHSKLAMGRGREEGEYLVAWLHPRACPGTYLRLSIKKGRYLMELCCS